MGHFYASRTRESWDQIKTWSKLLDTNSKVKQGWNKWLPINPMGRIIRQSQPMEKIAVFWGGEEGLLAVNLWPAVNFHRESAEQQMLSKMDTNMLSSCCDRSIMGEQLSKMNSISTVSQYKCHKLRRTRASTSPIPYSELCKSELAFKRCSRSRKALFTRTATLGKTLLLHAKSATLWNYTFSNTYAPTVALSFSSCRKQISAQ